MIDAGTTSDMTLAVLSFETRKPPACLRFRSDDLHIDEGRDLEPHPPFVDWLGVGGQHAQGMGPVGGRVLFTHRANAGYLAAPRSRPPSSQVLSGSWTDRRQMCVEA